MGHLNDFFNKFEKYLNDIENGKRMDNPQFEKFETPWGPMYYYSNITYSTPGSWDTMSSSSTQPSVGDRIKQLEQELSILVAKEDYENAAKLRDQLKDLKENYNEYETRLKELNDKKRLAVQAQDYESAAKYKKEIEDLAATSSLRQIA